VTGLYQALQWEHTKTACFFIKQAIHHFEIDIETLNIWMTLDLSTLGCKLHGILIAIAKNDNFLQDLNRILSESKKNELYQAIIKAHEPIIALRHPLGKEPLKNLGYNSNDEFWEAMNLSLSALKDKIETP
ncbi:MAG: hypothetical protein ACK4M7_03670, partial [Burkholderiales bacterium]